MGKNLALWKIFDNWVCTCHFSLLTQKLKMGPGTRVIATRYPVPNMAEAANH